jgi:F0F1-type ATP synthase alpha subunit
MDTADIPVLIDHTGVNDIFDEQVGFYPVPVKAGAVLTFNDWVADQNMDIFMLNGQVACSVKSVNGVVKLPEHLQTGVYSIRFLTPAGIQRRKLLVAD